MPVRAEQVGSGGWGAGQRQKTWQSSRSGQETGDLDAKARGAPGPVAAARGGER